MKKVFNKRMMSIVMMVILIFTLVGCETIPTSSVPTTEYENVGNESNATEIGGDNIVVATPVPTPNPDELPNNERPVYSIGAFYYFETVTDNVFDVDKSLLDSDEVIKEFTTEDTLTSYDTEGHKIGYIGKFTLVKVLAKSDVWFVFQTLADDTKYFAYVDEVVPEGILNETPIATPTPEVTPEPTTTPTPNVTPEPVVTDDPVVEPTPEPTTTPEPTPTPIAVTEMNATKYAIQSVNVRKGPGTEYDKVGGLTTNEAITVTGKTDNGWFRFTYNGAEAYVSAKYVADTKVVIPTPAPTPVPTPVPENPTPEVPTPTPVVPDNPAPPAPPTEEVSHALIMSKLESAMYAAGYKKPADVCTPEEIAEFGPTIGMSWGIATIDDTSMEKVDEYIAEAVSMMSINGWDIFYIEYSGINPNNGWCDIKVYGSAWY